MKSLQILGSSITKLISPLQLYGGSKIRKFSYETNTSNSQSLENLKVLFIGGLWPERRSSAAGVRTWSLVEILKNCGCSCTYFAPSKDTVDTAKELQNFGVKTATFLPNDSRFDREIESLQPHLVIFDGFWIEEQFGWRIRKYSPKTTLVIDTQDCFFLRLAREAAVSQGKSLEYVKNLIPDATDETTLRFLASVHRSDHSLVVSSYEKELLANHYGISEHKLTLAPFFYPPPKTEELLPFDKRSNFVMIGNFLHRPNVDQFKWVREEIWPKIRKQLPSSSLHVYGAYPNHIIMQMSNPEQGVFIKGHVQDQYETLHKYRVNLAPLRFGAGIKGKIADGWVMGTPCVTTPIGSEGMTMGTEFGGAVCDTVDDIVDSAVKLYNDSNYWQQAQKSGFRVIRNLFDRDTNKNTLINVLIQTLNNRDSLRKLNYVGEMLWYQNNRSTEFFSRYLELKKQTKSETTDVPDPREHKPLEQTV